MFRDQRPSEALVFWACAAHQWRMQPHEGGRPTPDPKERERRQRALTLWLLLAIAVLLGVLVPMLLNRFLF